MRIATIALMLGACTHTPPTIMFEDGKEALIAKCDATMGKCYRDATQYCPGGYDVVKLNRMEHASGISAKTLVGMVYRCKSAEAAPSR